MYCTPFIIFYYDQQMHNYFTNYHTPTCFDTIMSSSGSLKSISCQVTPSISNTAVVSPTAVFTLAWEMFQTKFAEKTTPHILFSMTFSPKILPFMR